MFLESMKVDKGGGGIIGNTSLEYKNTHPEIISNNGKGLRNVKLKTLFSILPLCFHKY